MNTLPDPEQSEAFRVLLRLTDVRRPYFEIMVQHGSLVAAKALQGARRVAHLGPDMDFIYEAALLHDIGMIYTHAPSIDCHGKLPYLRHGVIGSGLLQKEGLKRHARVCETHVGVCISREDIERDQLALPLRDYHPQTLEEELIAWADKFYSKKPGRLTEEKPLQEILEGIKKYGPNKGVLFQGWQERFG